MLQIQKSVQNCACFYYVADSKIGPKLCFAFIEKGMRNTCIFIWCGAIVRVFHCVWPFVARLVNG